MTTFDWAEIRASAVKRFHDAPDAALEQRILDVFREHPALVVEGVAHVSARYAKGDIVKPWVILAMHVEQAVTPLENVTATDTRDRKKSTERTEAWMRAAGMHFDSEDEVLDELFGDAGRLRHWRKDEQMRERMLRLWQEVRPVAEQLDQDAEARAERWMATTGAMRLANVARIRKTIEEASREPVAVGATKDPDDGIPF